MLRDIFPTLQFFQARLYAARRLILREVCRYLLPAFSIFHLSHLHDLMQGYLDLRSDQLSIQQRDV